MYLDNHNEVKFRYCDLTINLILDKTSDLGSKLKTLVKPLIKLFKTVHQLILLKIL